MVFANHADQRLYLAGEPGPSGAGFSPKPLTPAPLRGPGTTSLRFADFILAPGGAEVWCVQERHDDAKVTRSIVAVPLNGSAAADGNAIRQLVTGADFYAFPTPSPDGRRLAWICWNHPRMPWDGTELRVASVEDGMPGKGWLVKGGVGESVLAPLWRDETSLYVISDWPGWWNIYHVELEQRHCRGHLPGRGGVHRPALAARAPTIRGAERRPARGAARLRRDAAWLAGPRDRGAVRSRHSLPGLRDRAVGRRHVRRGRGGRAVHAGIGDPGRRGNREGEEALFGRRPLPAPGFLPRPRKLQFNGKVRPNGARLGLPASQPGCHGARRANARRTWSGRTVGPLRTPTGFSTWRRRTSPAGASASST